MSGEKRKGTHTLPIYTIKDTHKQRGREFAGNHMILHLWVVQVFDVLWHHSLAFNSTQLCCGVSFYCVIVMTINFGIFSVFQPWLWYSVLKLNLYYIRIVKQKITMCWSVELFLLWCFFIWDINAESNSVSCLAANAFAEFLNGKIKLNQKISTKS